MGLTQWFNTDSGFEFNTLFNTFAIVDIEGLQRQYTTLTRGVEPEDATQQMVEYMRELSPSAPAVMRRHLTHLIQQRSQTSRSAPDGPGTTPPSQTQPNQAPPPTAENPGAPPRQKRCAAMTQGGGSCKQLAMPGESYCMNDLELREANQRTTETRHRPGTRPTAASAGPENKQSGTGERRQQPQTPRPPPPAARQPFPPALPKRDVAREATLPR